MAAPGADHSPGGAILSSRNFRKRTIAGFAREGAFTNAFARPYFDSNLPADATSVSLFKVRIGVFLNMFNYRLNPFRVFVNMFLNMFIHLARNDRAIS
jgi:hypothetical protein